MRKAAEPPDDLGMAVDEGHELRRLVTLPGTMGLDPGLEQGDAALLVRQGFAVLERHIEEEAAVQGYLLVQPLDDNPVGDSARPGVGGEGPGRAAIEIAGNLVQQDDQ